MGRLDEAEELLSQSLRIREENVDNLFESEKETSGMKKEVEDIHSSIPQCTKPS